MTARTEKRMGGGVIPARLLGWPFRTVVTIHKLTDHILDILLSSAQTKRLALPVYFMIQIQSAPPGNLLKVVLLSATSI